MSVDDTYLPDSKIVNESVELSRTLLAPYLFNHVMRGASFAALLLPESGVEADPELLAIAVVLHDLGMTEKFWGAQRFEVDGANAARDFLAGRGISAQDLQLVWDAIALHTTGSLALHKEPVVALCHVGIAMDVVGIGLDRIAPSDLTAITDAYPRLAFKTQFAEGLCGLARRKPQTTYDNFVRDIGERYVQGYQRPATFADYLQNAPYDE